MAIRDKPDGRAWVARIRFPGLNPCWFGTVFCRLEAMHHEIEAEVRRVALEHLPDGFEIVSLEPGCLVFVPEKE